MSGKDRSEDAPLADSAQALRQRAEAAVAAIEADGQRAYSPEEARQLLHELQVHQIELELQNEELRRTQDELELSRRRYFALYDLAPVGYVTLSVSGLIQEANLTAAAALQVPRGALPRRPLSAFIAPEDQDGYYRHRRLLAETGAPQTCEVRMMRADHHLSWARLESAVVQDVESGETVYLTAISDITARRQAQAALREINQSLERLVSERTAELSASEGQLRQANAELARSLRLKDEFLAMMSHELRTPLTVILGTTEAMSAEFYGSLDAGQHEALATVTQSGQHLLRLLADILDLTRIEAGQERLEFQLVDLAITCATAIMFVHPAAQAKDIHLYQMIAPGLTELLADERRLTQILVNLLDNAVKFTPAGGTVGLEVTANIAQGCLQFCVSDTGIGIGVADQELIFEPFIQVDGHLSRQYGGVGLGLTLVRRLIELHGGSISLESAPGQGSRFTVRLPWPGADNRVPKMGDVPQGE